MGGWVGGWVGNTYPFVVVREASFHVLVGEGGLGLELGEEGELEEVVDGGEDRGAHHELREKVGGWVEWMEEKQAV